jgi:hypothetical protein
VLYDVITLIEVTVLIDVITLIDVVVSTRGGLELAGGMTTELELELDSMVLEVVIGITEVELVGLAAGRLVLLEDMGIGLCTLVAVTVLIDVTTLVEVLVETELVEITGGTTAGGTKVELELVLEALGGTPSGLCGLTELNWLGELEGLSELDEVGTVVDDVVAGAVELNVAGMVELVEMDGLSGLFGGTGLERLAEFNGLAGLNGGIGERDVAIMELNGPVVLDGAAGLFGGTELEELDGMAGFHGTTGFELAGLQGVAELNGVADVLGETVLTETDELDGTAGLCDAAGTVAGEELSGIETGLELVLFDGRVMGPGVKAATEELEVMELDALVEVVVLPGSVTRPGVNVIIELNEVALATLELELELDTFGTGNAAVQGLAAGALADAVEPMVGNGVRLSGGAAELDDFAVVIKLGLGSVTRGGGAITELDVFAVLIKLGLGKVTSVGGAGIETDVLAGETAVSEAAELAALVEFEANPGNSKAVSADVPCPHGAA